MPVQLSGLGLVVALTSLSTLTVTSAVGWDPGPIAPRPSGKTDKKADPTGEGAAEHASLPVLATLADTHSPLRLVLDDEAPAEAQLETLLRDPVLGSTHRIEPAILGLLRTLAKAHPGARIEVVSGFRSPKLNEALRKKGHHVALHSQHSLGHAMDLRIVPVGSSLPIDPRALSAEIRGTGWAGGVGIYLGKDDRFVHADVGPRRTWYGQ